MTSKNICRCITAFFLVALLGPRITADGPILGPNGWMERRFDDDRYARLHYWLPGIYRFRAYHWPVTFTTPADPYPMTPAGAQPYPFKDPPVQMPAPSEINPGEMKKDGPRLMPPAGAP